MEDDSGSTEVLATGSRAPRRVPVALACARLALVPAGAVAVTAAFLPWYESLPAPQSPPTLVAALAALMLGVWALSAKPRATPSFVPDLLTAVCAFAALFSSALYLGQNSGDIYGHYLVPSGLREGVVVAAIGASAVMVLSALIGLGRVWGERSGGPASAGRLPSAVLVPLMAAVLLEVTSAALPFHAIRDYVYGLQVRTLLEDGLGWAVLVDAAVIALLVVTGLVGSAIWTRVLVWLSAALTVAVPVLFSVEAFTRLASEPHEYALGPSVLAVVALCRVGALVALVRRWRVSRRTAV